MHVRTFGGTEKGEISGTSGREGQSAAVGEAPANLRSEVVGGQDVFVLGAGSPPRVVELEALVAEVGLAVGAALGGLQRLGGLAEAADDGDTAQADGVPVP